MFPAFFNIGYGVRAVSHGSRANILVRGFGTYDVVATCPAKGAVILEVHGKTATLHNAPGGTIFGELEALTLMFNSLPD